MYNVVNGVVIDVGKGNKSNYVESGVHLCTDDDEEELLSDDAWMTLGHLLLLLGNDRALLVSPSVRLSVRPCVRCAQSLSKFTAGSTRKIHKQASKRRRAAWLTPQSVVRRSSFEVTTVRPTGARRLRRQFFTLP